jgi:hypothetical protein
MKKCFLNERSPSITTLLISASHEAREIHRQRLQTTPIHQTCDAATTARNTRPAGLLYFRRWLVLDGESYTRHTNWEKGSPAESATFEANPKQRHSERDWRGA